MTSFTPEQVRKLDTVTIYKLSDLSNDLLMHINNVIDNTKILTYMTKSDALSKPPSQKVSNYLQLIKAYGSKGWVNFFDALDELDLGYIRDKYWPFDFLPPHKPPSINLITTGENSQSNNGDIDRLKTQLLESNNKANILQNNYNNQIEQLRNSQKKLVDVESENRRLSELLDFYQKKSGEALSENKRLSEQLSNSQQKLRDIQSNNYQERFRVLESENKRLSEQLVQYKENIALSTNVNQIANYRKRIEDLESEKSLLNLKLQDFKRDQADMTMELNDIQSEVTDLRDENRSLRLQLQELQNNQRYNQRNIQENNSSELNTLRNRVLTLQNENQTLQSQLQQLQNSQGNNQRINIQNNPYYNDKNLRRFLLVFMQSVLNYMPSLGISYLGEREDILATYRNKPSESIDLLYDVVQRRGLDEEFRKATAKVGFNPANFS